MASCVSPVVIDLSSDSEHGNVEGSQSNSSQPINDAFAFDWEQYEYPTSAEDILQIENEPENDEQDKASISSADTEIYTSETFSQTRSKSPQKQSSSQTLSKVERKIQKQHEKLMKEKSRLEKKRLREEKKAEELKQRRLRAAVAQKHKNLKPEENIKLLNVNIDTKVLNSEFGAILITTLQQACIRYEVGNQIKPFTIIWSKTVKDIIISDEGITQENVGVKEEKELLYVIDSYEMIKLVNSNELLTHIQTIKSVYNDKCLTLVITGMEKYFDLQKKKLSQCNASHVGKKRKQDNLNDPQFLLVTKNEIQNALIELQIIGNCNHCLIDTGEELASLVVSTTKSLSQLDYKKEKHQREEGELDWFAKGDSKQCVKVDKNGSGLAKLWQQQICQFNAVGIEMASAIISSYPSPHNLINSYKGCSSQLEGELLLQNIQMRRNAGILSSTRRIGPELSKKLYNFYMSDDPELEL